MLLAIQPLTDYVNLRTCLALLVLASFLAWTQLGKKGSGRRHGGGRRHHHKQHQARQQDRHCDKCEQQLLEQLGSGVRPVVSWNVRTLRRLPLRLVSEQ